MNFRLIKDWCIPSQNSFFEPEDTKIYKKGHIFSPNSDNKYIFENPISGKSRILSFDEILEKTKGIDPLFEVLSNQNVELIVEELTEHLVDKDNDVKKWRIQLDVNTSMNNLKEIKKFIEANIPQML